MPRVTIEEFVAAVEAAERRLATGEARARQAQALLVRAERARDEAVTRQAQAEQQLAATEAALRKARALRALVGDEVISQGEALLEQTRAEAQAEVTSLQAEAQAAQAQVEQLMATPEVRAYLDYREAQERARRRAREQARKELEGRLAALRPGVALGQGVEPLEQLADEAREAGFPDLAAQAADAVEAARGVAAAQAQAQAALRRRRLVRWAEGRAGKARPGDFVFVMDRDEAAGTALHLRPLAARSGRLRFRVVAALGVENPPDEYGDVPARGRAWRWRNPPSGDPEGLSQAQAGVVARIARGRLRSGWAINRANARLPRRVTVDQAPARKAQDVELAAGAEEACGVSGPADPEPKTAQAGETGGEAEPRSQAEPDPPAQDETGPQSLSPSPSASPARDAAEGEGQDRTAPHSPSAPTITVEGDGVPGQRLAQWRGAALVGLTPVARRLGLEEIQVLVCEEHGQATLVACWPGGEATVSGPADGRAGQMHVVREVIGQITA